MWPPDGVIFLTKRIIWTNLVEVLLGDATYQISSWKSIFSLCDLDMQWIRNHLNNF